MIYFIVSIILMLLSFSRRETFFYLSFIPVACYFTTHYGYGFDWINYYNTYVWSSTMVTSPYEPGIFYIMQFFEKNGLSYGSFMFFILLFNYVCLFIFCIKQKHKMFCFFALFSFFGFYMYSEQIRQGVAISIIMLGVSFHGVGSKKTIIYTLIASLFHISALFFIVCFLVNTSDRMKFKRNITIIISTVVVMLISFIFPSILSFIPYIGTKIIAYSQSYNAGLLSFITAFILSKYTWLYVFLLLLVIQCQKEYSNNMYNSIQSICFLLLSKTTPILMRFGFYFILPLVIGLDAYMYDKNKAGSIFLKKTAIYFSILLVSSATMWSSTLSKASSFSLNVFTDQDIEIIMSKKCTIAYKDLYGVDLFPSCYQ
ncbi:EpsG family protein [Klebsiella michiganensis]|uniref:EpsG family protein n=1 Tax=Klebsiella michiganensis TaxID=1134687 RepID=UPI0012B96581|nr:EpsG family protein [Klebsiella michiganensis]EKV4190124.1 EpsG family protein [Klebsiella michiganensis]HED3412336.1 EpsG family protein [Klebsiella michiganensis]